MAIEISQSDKGLSAVKLHYAVHERLILTLAPGETGGTYKLSIRAKLDPNTASMCDAAGTESGGKVTFELNTFTQEFKRFCDQTNTADAAAGSSSVWLEIYDENAAHVLLQKQITAVYRAATLSGQPPAPVENYLPAPAGGTAGQVLKKTASGYEWGDCPEPQVQSDWEQTDSSQKDYIKNKPEIPSSLAELDEDSAHQSVTAAQKSAWNAALSGQQITAVSAVSGTVTITPEHEKIFRYTAAASETVVLDSSPLTAAHAVTFELWIAQPSTAASFTLPNNVVWGNGSKFSTAQSAPDLSGANTLYCLVFRWNGTRLLGNLAYEEVLP